MKYLIFFFSLLYTSCTFAQGVKFVTTTGDTTANLYVEGRKISIPINAMRQSDSSKFAKVAYVDSSVNAQGVIFSAGSAVTVTNTTTATSLISTSNNYGTTSLPANFFHAGRTLHIIATGYISSDATAAGTVAVSMKIGSSTVNSIGSFTYTNNLVSRLVTIEIYVTCYSVGTSGTTQSQGWFSYNTSSTAEARKDMVKTNTITLNTTVSNAVDLLWTWGSALSTNSVTITNLYIDSKG